MTQEEDNVKILMGLAEAYASRYRDPQEHEDLMQEGLLAALEELHRGKDMTLATGAMRKAMNDYKNVSLKPVTIPKSGAVRKLLSALSDPDGVTPQGTTQKALYDALCGSVEEIQPQTLRSSKSSEDILIEKDMVEYIRNNLWVFLKPREAVTLDLIYFEEYDPVDVADALEVTEAAISQYRVQGLKKLRAALEQLK